MVSAEKRARASTALRLILCALTTLSLSLSYAPASEPTVMLPDMAVWALCLAGMWTLYGAGERLKLGWGSARYWILAALFSAVVTLTQSFLHAGTAELITQKALKSALYFAGRLPLYYTGMRLLEAALARDGAPKKPRPLLWGGALMLCWLPWYALIFPGTVSNDSVTQIKEILGLIPVSAGNPVFQTALIDFFRIIGAPIGGADAAVALYCIVQAALMAWLLGALVGEAEGAGAPAWLKWGMLAFYAFCPIFPLFAFCVGKDTNFAMAVLLLSVTLWRIIRNEGRAGARDWICLCASSVLCALLRNPGVYLAALSLALLLAWSLVKKRRAWAAALAALCLTAGVYLTLELAVIPALDIEPTPETENYSIPLQQTARVAASCELTPGERAAIDGVLELDSLKDKYNGELSDPIKFLWRENATDEQKREFFKTWLSLVKKHPATCASATFHNTYGYLSPGYVSLIKPTLIFGAHGDIEDIAEGFGYTVNPRTEFLKSTVKSLYKSPLFRVLVSPGLYGWITLFAIAALRRRRASLIPAFPALFTLAGCMLSAVNAYFRYAMPLYLCAPFLLLICSRGGSADKGRNEA